MEPPEYGRFYYCVLVSSGLGEGNEVYVFGDQVVVGRSGELLVFRGVNGERRLNLLVAPGYWRAVFAASVLNAAPVAVVRGLGWEAEGF